MSTGEFTPDAPLSTEQARVAASLSPEFVAKIDAELLSHAKPSYRKIAMLVGMAMGNSQVRVPGLPDIFDAQRVRELVTKGQLGAEGNLDFMRFSEVRLPRGR